MSNFFNELDRDMKHAADKARQSEDAAAAADLVHEMEQVDELYATDVARQQAITERQITLDWAWGAASLLNEANILPTDAWEYDYTEKRGIFGRQAMKDTAGEGWKLLDWQNTRYYPLVRHTLLLTPSDQDNSSIHLRYFSQETSRDNIPYQQLQPADVHELARVPLSATDMPWPDSKPPGKNNASVLDTSRGIAPQPWQDTLSLTFNAFDRTLDAAQSRQMTTPLLNEDAPTTEQHSAEDYNIYIRSQTELAIRRAIAGVAAKYLVVSPDMATKSLDQRVSDLKK